MRVAITHTTRLDYGADVVEAVMDTRLGPRSDVHQRWDVFELRAAPSAAVRSYSDGFGNAAHLITIAGPIVTSRSSPAARSTPCSTTPSPDRLRRPGR